MKFTIENLGKIQKAELELNDLTILVGNNNSGKTYITYAIYGILNSLSLITTEEAIFTEIVKGLENNQILVLKKDKIINILSKMNKVRLNNSMKKELFNDKEKLFSSTNISCEFDINKKLEDIEKKSSFGINFEVKNEELTLKLDKDDEFNFNHIHAVLYIIFSKIMQSIQKSLDKILITAERLGISLFYKELDEKRSDLITEIQKGISEKEINNLISNKTSYYSRPIKDHISFVRKIDEIENNHSQIDVSYPLSLIFKILGADFKRNNQNTRIFSEKENFDIPLYLASSSARCIVDIYFFLKYKAKEGSILMIDEPESHLTLENQREMAKLLVAIINSGIKVFITTHSDFLIKELNNLIMLSNDFKDKKDWIKKYNYSEKDFLNHNSVSIYESKNGTLEKLKINNKGIEIPFFDKQITDLFQISSDLDYLIEDEI